MATVTAQRLIDARYAQITDTLEYTSTDCRTIIDKFTFTNQDSGAILLTVYIVPTGQAVGNTYKILDVVSVAAHTCRDCTELQNQILESGDKIYVKCDTASKGVIRSSGRKVA